MSSPDELKNEPTDRESGVQSLDRAASILRMLALAGAQGSRLAEVSQAVGLGKTTTHRLINALLRLGFVERGEEQRRYRLGLEVYTLAMAARSRLDIIELARPSLVKLAQQTGDTVFLSIPDRYEAVCVDRQVGPFPIRTLTLNIGDRRPLGVGAGSLALLSALPEQDRRKAMEANFTRQLITSGLEYSDISKLIEETHALGYSFNDGRIVSGMSAVGVAIPGRDDRPVAALSVAAITDRMDPVRRRSAAVMLRQEAALISQRWDPVRNSRRDETT